MSTDAGPYDGPDQIGPDHSPKTKKSIGEHVSSVAKAFTTKDGLLGNCMRFPCKDEQDKRPR